ncbi:MAG: hypothetical protein RBR28_15220 [Lentimicrobium sp.]|jgi:hypothetical protein|nr:hypothetical protein [Lentimicrobium sp.]
MNLHKLTLLLVFVAGLSGHLIAQDTFNPDLYQAATPASSSLGISKLPPVQFNLQTGALFSAGFGGGNLFSTFIAPSFNQPLGKKFTLTAGAVISNTTYNNLLLMDGEGSINGHYGNLTTFTLYTGGSYQLNERLTLSGAAYKTINPAFNERLHPDRLSMKAQGVSFGVGYKVSDNLHIGGEIRLQQGNNNFYTPYGFPGNGLMQRGMFGY